MIEAVATANVVTGSQQRYSPAQHAGLTTTRYLTARILPPGSSL